MLRGPTSCMIVMQIPKSRQRKILESTTGREAAALGKQLVTIQRDLELPSARYPGHSVLHLSCSLISYRHARSCPPMSQSPLQILTVGLIESGTKAAGSHLEGASGTTLSTFRSKSEVVAGSGGVELLLANQQSHDSKPSIRLARLVLHLLLTMLYNPSYGSAPGQVSPGLLTLALEDAAITRNFTIGHAQLACALV